MSVFTYVLMWSDFVITIRDTPRRARVLVVHLASTNRST